MLISRCVLCVYWWISAPPHLVEKPQDVQKAIDESLLWECKASAKPKPSYRWLKNGEPIESFEVSDPVRCNFSVPEKPN